VCFYQHLTGSAVPTRREEVRAERDLSSELGTTTAAAITTATTTAAGVVYG
jgi:hypothetical protein